MATKSSYLSISSELNQAELLDITGTKPSKSMLLTHAMAAIERGLKNYSYSETESIDKAFSPNVVHKKAPATLESTTPQIELGH